MESGIQRHGIRNPQRGIRNPGLSWITLHGAIYTSFIIPPKSDRIPIEFSSVHDKSINDAVSIINEIEAGCFMAKTDVKSALRIIPIHPSDDSMLGMKWQNPILIYRCLPMGCSSSCAIFEACRTALEWLAMTCFGASGVLYILGDLLFLPTVKRDVSPVARR